MWIRLNESRPKTPISSPLTSTNTAGTRIPGSAVETALVLAEGSGFSVSPLPSLIGGLGRAELLLTATIDAAPADVVAVSDSATTAIGLIGRTFSAESGLSAFSLGKICGPTVGSSATATLVAPPAAGNSGIQTCK